MPLLVQLRMAAADLVALVVEQFLVQEDCHCLSSFELSKHPRHQRQLLLPHRYRRLKPRQRCNCWINRQLLYLTRIGDGIGRLFQQSVVVEDLAPSRLLMGQNVALRYRIPSLPHPHHHATQV